MSIAPVLFNAGLLAFLRGRVPDGPEDAASLPFTVEGVRRYMHLTGDSSKIEDGLLATRYKLDQYGHPRP
jgi:hypothetical protein